MRASCRDESALVVPPGIPTARPRTLPHGRVTHASAEAPVAGNGAIRARLPLPLRGRARAQARGWFSPAWSPRFQHFRGSTRALWCGGLLVPVEAVFGPSFAGRTASDCPMDYSTSPQPDRGPVHFRQPHAPATLRSASRGRLERPATWLCLQGAKKTRSPSPEGGNKRRSFEEGPPLI